MFKKAKPMWLKNMRKISNLQVGFRCDFEADAAKEYVLVITGATFYKVYMNGEFVCFGPARTAHGYAKCDEIKLKVKNGINKLAVEAAGYNCSSFYTVKTESFLCAEILSNGEAICWTGRDFKAFSLEKLRNICAARYSYQRTYGEVWHYDNNDDLNDWKENDRLTGGKIYSFEHEKKYIPRNLPEPNYDIDNALGICEKGKIVHKELDMLEHIRYFSALSNYIDGYRLEDIPENPASELYGDFIPESTGELDTKRQIIHNDEYAIYELGTNNTGFIRNNIIALEDSSVYIFFSEHNYGNGMIFESLNGQCNIIKYNLKKSDKPYILESFEPYVCKYIGVAVTKGMIMVAKTQMREYSYPIYNNTVFKTEDDDLNLIFKAAQNSFRQNTVDVFMDCPGRERAGWLCDTFFTSWSEKLFTGENCVEKEFLNNFVIADEFPNIPTGMLPMIYPGEISKYGGGFIPQWAMWYVIELWERCSLRHKEENILLYKKLCYDLLEWFKQYENSDGLLEKMPGWNFIEWSDANNWTEDVNYPTNMLYGKVLEIIGKLYEDDSLIEKSRKINETVIEQSFDGHFFADNAVRDQNGVLHVTENRSEVCQYYAYFTGIASMKDKKFEKLTDTVLNIFGPERKANGKLKEIAYANAFIGNYLRMIILQKNGKFDKCVCEIKQYFLKMAKTTGTLWEHDDLMRAKRDGSLNHGFASFIGVVLPLTCAGIGKINYNKKTICIDHEYKAQIDFELTINTSEGKIVILQKSGEKKISLPNGWKTEETGDKICRYII